MSKYYGKIGYTNTTEVDPINHPGVWTDVITERPYFGDIYRSSRRLQTTENLNDSIAISNEISIIADAYAYENYASIRYAEFMGIRWKVVNIEVQRPRLLLTLGGEYNEEPKPSSQQT